MATPVKLPDKDCCFCGSQDIPHLACVGRKLQIQSNFKQQLFEVLGKTTSQYEARFLFICRKCCNKLQQYAAFKQTSLTCYARKMETLQREKRLHRTPQSHDEQQPKKKPNISTVEWLVKSVEKLNIQKGAHTEGRKSRKKLLLEDSSPGDATLDRGEGELIEGVRALPPDHSYAKKPVIYRPERVEEAVAAVRNSGILMHAGGVVTQTECSEIAKLLTSSHINASNLAFLISKVPGLWLEIKQFLLKEMESNLQTGFQHKKSILFEKQVRQVMNNDLFAAIILEAQTHVPFLLDILSVCCRGNDESARVAIISTIFGMMMNTRNKHASVVQRMYSTLCIRFHADNKLLNRLNIIHLTLSERTKADLISDLGAFATDTIVSKVKCGSDGKINGDNLDFRVRSGDMRLSSRDKDFHFFASDWTPDRIDATGLPNDKPCGDVTKVSVETFLTSPAEIGKFKEDLKVLLGRDLSETFPCFRWMKLVLPAHIPHDHSAAMSTKSHPCIMPVLLKNEASYSDCIAILKSYQQQAKSWYLEAGREDDYEKLSIPIGGDQLTRVRLQGAKLLLAGSHTSDERMENLSPMIIELFHTMQDFLEKLCKKFLNVAKGREKCTLANLRVILQRVNVNEQVKVRFKAHEDFVMTAGKAYVSELAMEYFEMTDKEASPSVNKAPENVDKFAAPRRQKAFDAVMDPFIDKYLSIFQLENEVVPEEPFGRDLLVRIQGTETEVKGCVDQDSATTSIVLAIGDHRYNLKIPVNHLKKDKEVKVSLPGVGFQVQVKAKKKEEDDEALNYVLNFLQWYFVMKNFRDAIKEGDMCRTNISLKLMIPFFFSHSKLSKYLVECMDYVLKTEVLLSPRMSLRVKAGSFVNRKGKPGKNKPADMEKENQVKFLKDLIRGLGQGKTEKSVVKISKAGPVMLDVVSNFDTMSGIVLRSTSHKAKSSEEDLDALYKHLRRERPLRKTPGRKLQSFTGITCDPFHKIDRNEFREHLSKTADRLVRNQATETEEEED